MQHLKGVLENKAGGNLCSLSISLPRRKVSHSYAIDGKFVLTWFKNQGINEEDSAVFTYGILFYESKKHPCCQPVVSFVG